jgi:hypothetical protein
MPLLRIQELPAEALEASALFHSRILPFIETMLAQGAGTLTLGLNRADHTHRDWRLALVRQLARKHAPMRVNAVAGGNEAAQEAAARYLDGAEGVTGQYLPLDDFGAGDVLGSQA